MTILDELIYYCNDPEPVGALMLTGEWGCGKSYFANHDFADAVKGKCIIVRVSLFGIASMEALHAAIKNEEKIDIQHKVSNNTAGTENKDDVKHVVVDNLYMQEVKEEIPYREIKEKAIQRTVAYTPDFKAIIESIVDSFKLPDISSAEYKAYFEYQQFLSKHKAELVGIFEIGIPQDLANISLSEEEEQKVRAASNPHNLRSYMTFSVCTARCRNTGSTRSKNICTPL